VPFLVLLIFCIGVYVDGRNVQLTNLFDVIFLRVCYWYLLLACNIILILFVSYVIRSMDNFLKFQHFVSHSAAIIMKTVLSCGAASLTTLTR